MFRYGICDPLKEAPIDMGPIDTFKLLDVVDRFPWQELVDKVKDVDESKIYFSPSLEIENTANRHSITISNIGGVPEHEVYIFYKRPKLVSKFFGLIRYQDENFLSDRTEQTLRDAREAVIALINDDFKTLEERWG